MVNLAESQAKQTLRFFLLGNFRVAIGPAFVDDARWRRRKASALLKLLALSPAHRLHREEISALLWPDAEPAAAANNVHQALYLARHSLEPGAASPARWLRLEDDFLNLSPDEPVWIDVDAFEAAAARARQSHAPGLFRQALELYGGDLLPEDRYDDWAVPRREALRHDYFALLMELAETYQALNETDAAIETLTKLVAGEPHHEPAHRALMEAYALAGQRDRALAQFEVLRRTLQADLAAEPDSVSQKLYRQIAAGDWSPRPVRLASPAPNLPAAITSFIGREHEMAEVRRLLESTRLLTLTGPGGCGKTRLAVEVAQAVADHFPDGAWFVDLAPLSDPNFVAHAVADVLGIPEGVGKSITETLAAVLHTRQALIVLDNCEHLTEACAQLCQSLLRACPKLKILATSREPLRITGEIVWLVPSLALPDLDPLPAVPELIDYAAVRLFVERAQAAAASFDLTEDNAAVVAQLCFHLDGIPLALELAAARVNVLSARQILSRLDERFLLLTRGSRTALTRQQTLRAAINWSYDLLSAEERVLFRRLSVFAGGWTLDQVEAICLGDGLDRGESLDRLSQLVDKSLIVVAIRAGEARYHFLETIRHYAAEKLHEAGETERIRNKHLDYFLRLAETTAPQLASARRAHGLEQLESEYANLRAALRWAQDGGLTAELLQLAGALYWFWYHHNYIAEGRRWLAAALASSSATGRLAPAPAESMYPARALYGAARLAHAQGENTTARSLLDQSVALWRVSGTVGELGLAHALLVLGWLARDGGDLTSAYALNQESVGLFRRQADQWGLAYALIYLGMVVRDQEDYPRARRLVQESIDLWRELGDTWGLGNAIHHQGLVALRAGGYAEASTLFESALALRRSLADKQAIAYSTMCVGLAALNLDDAARAQEYYTQSAALFRELGDQFGNAVCAHYLGRLLLASGDVARALSLFEGSLSLARETGPLWFRAASLMGFAAVAYMNGSSQPAIQLWGAAEAHMAAAGSYMDAADFRLYERTVARVAEQLGPDQFDAARADGRALPLEKAQALALAIPRSLKPE